MTTLPTIEELEALVKQGESEALITCRERRCPPFRGIIIAHIAAVIRRDLEARQAREAPKT